LNNGAKKLIPLKKEDYPAELVDLLREIASQLTEQKPPLTVFDNLLQLLLKSHSIHDDFEHEVVSSDKLKDMLSFNELENQKNRKTFVNSRSKSRDRSSSVSSKITSAANSPLSVSPSLSPRYL
jgi:hypothetical protein